MSHHPELQPSRTLFLVNPAAGAGSGRRVLQRIASLLQGEFREHRDRCVLEKTRPHGIAEQARKACADYSTIIAVGGDGTASWILRGILEYGGETGFGLIPLGTGNDLARSLGIYDPRIAWSKRALKRALATALSGKPHGIDLFRMEGAGPFCNYAGIGLDAKVLWDYTACSRSSWFRLVRWSGGLKFLCYGLLLLKNLRYRLPDGIEISLGSGTVRKTFSPRKRFRAVILSNTRTYAGGFVLQPASKIDDGKFEVTFVRGLPDILRILVSRFLPSGNLTSGLPGGRTDSMEWTAPPGLPLEWDGEISDATLPARGSVRRAGRIQVLLPRQTPLP